MARTRYPRVLSAVEIARDQPIPGRRGRSISAPVHISIAMRARTRRVIASILSVALGIAFGTLLLAGAGYFAGPCPVRVQPVSANAEVVTLCAPSGGQCSNRPSSTYAFRGAVFTMQTYSSCRELAWGIHGKVVESNGTSSSFELEEGAPPVVWLNWTSPDGTVSVDWEGGYGWNVTLEVRT